MTSRILLVCLFAALMMLTSATPCWASNAPEVDRVVVSKSDRQLYLMQGRTVVRAYPVSLGKNPVGHKLHKGDQRTPEGRYYLDWRNQESRYHLALHISYPNPKDRQRAAQQGVQPGGSIMLHGLPKKYADGARVLLDLDWTDGCIAVSNQAIEEIWQMVADNTIIEIFP